MENKDERLWQLATQRARFKGKILSYIAVNIFLWAIWYITGKNDQHLVNGVFPWPAWVSFGWGFGLVINYVKLYHINSENQIQKEYDKLRNKA